MKELAQLIFPLDRYTGPDNFCDRKKELNRLFEIFTEGRNVVLYSIRRLGKTGLIHHFHHSLSKRKKVVPVYLDVMDTNSDSEFANKLISACINALEKKKKGFLQNSIQLFSRFRPIISFDPITNSPSIQLDIEKPADIKLSIQTLIQLLGQQKYSFQIAIDEFQQISKYETTRIDATLRSHFQTATNIHYLFSGSENNLLSHLFFDANKPLFGSVELMELGFIEREEYASFIQSQLKKLKKSISLDLCHQILEWTEGHTFYTQYFCNKLNGKRISKISELDLKELQNEILYQYEVIYINYKKLLSKNQWKMLVGIAKEGTVKEYSARSFLSKYNLAQASAQQSIEALLKKSMIREELRAPVGYKVYDVYLKRWIERFV